MQKEKISPQQNAAEAAKNIPLKQESPNPKHKLLANSRIRDSSSKIIFDDNLLCSQFLRGYIDLDAFKNVKPEDIEDVSSQFVPLFEEERNADRVKKVTVDSQVPYFLLSLIEHKSQVDYNVCMQIFRYMIYIWNSYEKEMERLSPGISKTADFQYPPIIPIVYYEGRSHWTAPMSFKSKIVNGDAFCAYIPDFTYYLVPVHQYSNEKLLEGGDEISLIMLINKIQNDEDFKEFQKLPADKLNAILSGTPKYLREIIADVFLAFMLKSKVPVEEAVELADKVKEKHMGELFEHIDINLNMEEVRQQVTEQVTEQGIKALILSLQELNIPEKTVISKLTEHYALSQDEAKEKFYFYRSC